MQRTRGGCAAGDNADTVLLALGNRVGKLSALELAGYRYPQPIIDDRYNLFFFQRSRDSIMDHSGVTYRC